MNRAQHSKASSEWYTPPYIVEAAREVMGSIDLDPASNQFSNEQLVKASRFETFETNGLRPDPWLGNVFLNPPTPARRWWERMAQEFAAAGDGEAGIYVAFSVEQLQESQGAQRYPSQRWIGRSMLSYPVCFPKKRVRYYCKASDAISNLIKVINGRHAKGGKVGTRAEGNYLAELCSMDPNTLVEGDAPTHSSAIVGLNVDWVRFRKTFGPIGECVWSA